MPWRFLVTRYAWIVVTDEILRSPRWSEDQKIEAMFWTGVVMSIPFTVAHAFWLLTGRGPLQWLYRPNVAFVNPLPRWRPTDVSGALSRQRQARRERHGGEPPVFVP